MGRIRGKNIRSSTLEALRRHKDLFTDDFEHNKQTLVKIMSSDKTVRNKIAGYITKLAKAKKIEEYMIGHSTR